MTRKLVAFGTAVMTTLLALLVLWQFRVVVVYALISLALAAALRPLVSYLGGRSLMKRSAWVLLYLAAVGGFIYVLFQAVGSAISEIQYLARVVSAQDAWQLPIWLQGSSFQQALVARLPPPSMLFEAFTGNQGQLVLPALLGATQGIGIIVSGVIVILFLSIYWSINQIHFERLWLSLLPSGQRKEARGTWRTIEPDVGAYIRGEVVQSILTGLLLGLGYWLLGSPFPSLLGLAGAIVCLIPVVGVVLVVIPVLLLGLLLSVQLSLFTTLYALAVLVAMGAWVRPRLFNRRWDNPILTVLLLIALADSFGVVGIVVAPPFAAICQILWNHLVSRRVVSGAAAQLSDLQGRQARLLDTIKTMDAPVLPLVTSSMERLSLLMERAEPILQAGLPDSLPAQSIQPMRPSQSLTADDARPEGTEPGGALDDLTQDG